MVNVIAAGAERNPDAIEYLFQASRENDASRKTPALESFPGKFNRKFSFLPNIPSPGMSPGGI